MTNEEIIAILESYKNYEDSRTEDLLHHGYDNTKEAIKRKEALDEAIKALSENKGDLISREFLQTAIHNFFNGLNHTPTEEDIQRYIEVAPSVENKGEWIEKEMFDGDIAYECSKCGELFCLIDGTPTDNLYNFCPNCGADLRGGNE